MLNVAAQNTEAIECERLFQKQYRSRNFLEWVIFNDYLEKFGVWGETQKTIGPLDVDNGKGFRTEIHFSDGSVWVTQQMYFSSKDESIAFEKRGDFPKGQKGQLGNE